LRPWGAALEMHLASIRKDDRKRSGTQTCRRGEHPAHEVRHVGRKGRLRAAVGHLRSLAPAHGSQRISQREGTIKRSLPDGRIVPARGKRLLEGLRFPHSAKLCIAFRPDFALTRKLVSSQLRLDRTHDNEDDRAAKSNAIVRRCKCVRADVAGRLTEARVGSMAEPVSPSARVETASMIRLKLAARRQNDPWLY